MSPVKKNKKPVPVLSPTIEISIDDINLDINGQTLATVEDVVAYMRGIEGESRFDVQKEILDRLLDRESSTTLQIGHIFDWVKSDSAYRAQYSGIQFLNKYRKLQERSEEATRTRDRFQESVKSIVKYWAADSPAWGWIASETRTISWSRALRKLAAARPDYNDAILLVNQAICHRLQYVYNGGRTAATVLTGDLDKATTGKFREMPLPCEPISEATRKLLQLEFDEYGFINKAAPRPAGILRKTPPARLAPAPSSSGKSAPTAGSSTGSSSASAAASSSKKRSTTGSSTGSSSASVAASSSKKRSATVSSTGSSSDSAAAAASSAESTPAASTTSPATTVPARCEANNKRPPTPTAQESEPAEKRPRLKKARGGDNGEEPAAPQLSVDAAAWVAQAGSDTTLYKPIKAMLAALSIHGDQSPITAKSAADYIESWRYIEALERATYGQYSFFLHKDRLTKDEEPLPGSVAEMVGGARSDANGGKAKSDVKGKGKARILVMPAVQKDSHSSSDLGRDGEGAQDEEVDSNDETD